MRGSLAPAYNTFTNHRLASVCGDSEVWRAKVLDIVRRARALGLDGLYLDMIAAVGGKLPCFNPAHAHAPGGGCYGVQGFRETLRQARAVAPDFALSSEGMLESVPDFALSSEATLECYMDLLEGYITPGVSLERLKWQAEMCGGRSRVVPLFSAVYHGRCVCFGNYGVFDGVPPYDELWPPEFRVPPEQEKDWRALCPDQFALELARTVVFGFQPLVSNLTMAHLTEPRFAPDVDFLVHVCRTWHAHRELLLWGDMLPPGVIECGDCEVRFLQRFLFTKPGEETFLTRTFPAVLHSAWRAPDGRAAALLINYTREPVDVSYTPGGEFHAIAAGEWQAEGRGVRGTMGARSCEIVGLGEG